MERIERLNHEGKRILYFNLSDIKANEELSGVAEKAKEAISACEPRSVYTVTNVSGITFDSKTKEIAADWMSFNMPFVISAAFFGATGARRIMINAVFGLSSRKNARLFYDMEQALEWIGSL